MPYCTQEDIEVRYPEDQITDLTDDEGDGSLVDARVDAIILEQDDFINGYLRAQYDIPYAGGDKIVKSLSIDLSYVAIMRRRRAAENDEGIDELYKEQVKTLDKIAKGTIKLAGANTFQNTTGYIKSNKDSTDKVYTKTKLKRFTIFQ